MIHGKKEVQKHWCIQEICLERITFICLTQEKLSYENFFHRNIKSNNAVFLCIKELQFKKCEDKFSTRIILAKTYEYQYLQIWQTLWKKVTLISKVTLIGHGSYENFSFLCMVIAFSFLKMLRQLVWRLILRWKNVLDWKKCQISMYSEVFSPYKHALAALFRK